MVDCKVEEIFVDKDNMFEIVYQTLTVQKEHSRSEKVPMVRYHADQTVDTN